MRNKKIIVFDGMCILCNGFFQFILKRDTQNQFHFSTTQSEFVQHISKSLKIERNPQESILYMKNGLVLTESDAIIQILVDLGGFWKTSILFKCIPRFLRNGIYRLIAKKRYRLFGKRESCLIPGKELEYRFL